MKAPSSEQAVALAIEPVARAPHLPTVRQQAEAALRDHSATAPTRARYKPPNSKTAKPVGAKVRMH